MDQFLTLNKANIGPVFNSIYIYIYLCVYIYMPTSQAKGTHFAKSQFKQRDAQMSFVDRQKSRKRSSPALVFSGSG